ncbi:NACHT domain-containing protein [Brevundimonas sp.]|uniref:NACHT domain-containing protein n=1 Tax=Brevundimonas sp. TaxID=1871086 RepID=UPI002BC8E151|nr:helix-turn-helix domain-containing protein [Brevundimonas sp.]HWQ87914.1 helix-turn-helix domain-containing protein [Brevundimonas sp.]
MARAPVGLAVRHLRERKGWSPWDLATQAGVKLDTIRALETGDRRTRLHTIRTVASALGTNAEGLIELADRLSSSAGAGRPVAGGLCRHPDLFRRLAERSRIAAARIDSLRAGTRLELSLGRGLYVSRDIEAEIIQDVLATPDERRLIVVDGEPGTGKSSLLWHVQQDLAGREEGVAWLFDAIELPTVFAGPAGQLGVSDVFAELVEDLVATGKRLIILVDTIDVALNSTATPADLLHFLTSLNAMGVDVIVASRPLEARQFHLLSARIFHLFEYSDTELTRAIANYAAAFVGDVGEAQAQLHVDALLGAVAQGFPIREICRNPLTLRMLYTIYAPNQINVFDVNIIALYVEFWRRRVESDLRHDFQVEGLDQDLSAAAMHIAVVMLVEGIPEVARELLERELELALIPPAQIAGLEARGILATSSIGSQRYTSFFHQTFFEHAAAVAIVRVGGSTALEALAERWRETSENPFLGAVLERTLVLAEHGVLAVRTEAERRLDLLAQAGSSAAAVIAYVFVHRSAVPESVTRYIDAAIAAEDPLLIERLLDVAANAQRARQPDLFGALSRIMSIGNGRWASRALLLLLRFWGGNAALILPLLAGHATLPNFLGGRYKVPEARDRYLAFLGRLALENVHSDWAFEELVRLFNYAEKVGSEDFALAILGTLKTIALTVRGVVSRFREAARIGARHGKLTTLTMARELGEALHEEWRLSGTTIPAVVEGLVAAPDRDLHFNARLYGLGLLLASSAPGDVLDAFRRTGLVDDTALRVGLGRVTWAKALSVIAVSWAPPQKQLLFGGIRALTAVPGGGGDPYAAMIRFAWLEGRPSEPLLSGLFGKAWETSAFWADENLGGRRLADSASVGIEPAMAFLRTLAADPRRWPKLSGSVMQQIKYCVRPEAIDLLGLALAIELEDYAVVLALLQRRDDPPAWDAEGLSRLSAMVDRLRRRGDVSSRRLLSELELQLARLSLAPIFNWKGFCARLLQEDDEVVRSHLIMGFGHLPDAVQDSEARVIWLIQYAEGRGLKTRTAVMELATTLIELQPDLAAAITPLLMDIAFDGDTEGNLVALLQGPIYGLYRVQDARVEFIFKDLIARSANLPTHSCLRISRVFRRLSSLIMRRLNDAARVELLESVPQINRYLGRLIVQGAVEAGTQSLIPRLKVIAENPTVGADLISMTRRFIRREMRTSGLGRWPELYELVVGTPGRPNP